MAFRGRGGGRGRGRGRGGPESSRLARSGIRTRGGSYKKFDSQRVKDIERRSEEPEDVSSEAAESDDDSEVSEIDERSSAAQSYAALLGSLRPDPVERPGKRRKVEHVSESDSEANGQDASSESDPTDSEADSTVSTPPEGSATNEIENDALDSSSDNESDTLEDDETNDSPYEAHFTRANDIDLGNRSSADSYATTHVLHATELALRSISGRLAPSTATAVKRDSLRNASDTSFLKPRLQAAAREILDKDSIATLANYVFNYADCLLTDRAPQTAALTRRLLALHAVNHILIGRDRVLKNSARLARAKDDDMLELRDQGFTRPRVLILTETRQMCAKYADAIIDCFKPEQQENRQRFQDSFSDPVGTSDMPEDHQELFEGNNDNNFLTTMKFTRKNVKFYSAFYQADIIFASPLGLRRVIEHEDKKKQDHDFLSSIELVIVDQADAMQMQNWENVELVFKHLNLQPKELRDCDVNRVRNWYLDGFAKHLRQTIISSAYLTPELNRMFNAELQNVSGKIKLTAKYPGAIQSATGMNVKQTFIRFPTKSPLDDPDARFKFFTTSVLPALLRIPQPADGGTGILIFIPSYFDFLRVRNYFATSSMTENMSFGAVHDYTEVSDQRRARSHFVSGKHSILLYTQRAHHFFRLRLRGVKRVIMYGVPDNPIFYDEIVAGYLGTTLDSGVGGGECFARALFSKFDALKMERIVGSDRVRGMLAGIGDTFEFV